MFTCLIGLLDSTLMGFFSFTKVYLKYSEYLLVLATQPCLIWTISRGLLLRVSLGSFVQSSCSCFTAWFTWGSPLLSPCFCHSPLVWRLCQALACPFVPCSQLFYKALGWTGLRLQEMSQEVLSLLYVVIVSWHRRSHSIFVLDLRRSYFDGRLYSDYVRKEMII